MRGRPIRKKTYKRRQYLIDKPLQLSIACTAAALIVGSGLLGIGAFLVAPAFQIPDNLPGERVRDILIGTHVAYFVLAAGAVAVIAILLTHRIAGPAFVLRRAIKSFLEGDFHPRLTLRKKDYLKDLAADLQRLGAHFEARERVLEAVRASADASDLEGVRAALESVSESPTEPVQV